MMEMQEPNGNTRAETQAETEPTFGEIQFACSTVKASKVGYLIYVLTIAKKTVPVHKDRGAPDPEFCYPAQWRRQDLVRGGARTSVSEKVKA